MEMGWSNGLGWGGEELVAGNICSNYNIVGIQSWLLPALDPLSITP